MIACVEDDDAIRELVVYTLNQSGLATKGYPDAAAFFAATELALPQLVLLDIMLPDVDGLTILRRLRTNPKTAALPVMLLTAKGTEYDKVIGLDSGADDYLTKPFGMMELVSRVKALLRRAVPEKPKKDCLQIRNLTVDLTAHRALLEDRELPLTYKEFELLSLLMQNRGRVYTRDQLLEQIWGYAFDGESRTVDVHIRSLRAKLEPMGQLIETVRGVGYRISEGA